MTPFDKANEALQELWRDGVAYALTVIETCGDPQRVTRAYDLPVIERKRLITLRDAHHAKATPAPTTPEWVQWTRRTDGIVFRTNGNAWQLRGPVSGDWMPSDQPRWHNTAELDSLRAAWVAAGGR